MNIAYRVVFSTYLGVIPETLFRDAPITPDDVFDIEVAAQKRFKHERKPDLTSWQRFESPE